MATRRYRPGTVRKACRNTLPSMPLLSPPQRRTYRSPCLINSRKAVEWSCQSVSLKPSSCNGYESRLATLLSPSLKESALFPCLHRNKADSFKDGDNRVAKIG